MTKRGFGCLTLVGLLLSWSTAKSDVGITESEIHIGSTGAMTGDIAEIGTGMATGAQAFYDHLNANGGVNGRKIIYSPKDDGYDPARAVANVKSLIANDKILALVGGNGTPIAQAIMPMVEENGLLFLFTFSGGAIVFPNPPKKNIFQVRISYADEASSLVDYLIKDTGVTDVGIFYQDNAFGVSGRSGVEKTLAAHGLKIHGTGTYKRNTVDVDAAVDALMKQNPKALYLQAVGKPAVEFIKKCVAKGFVPIFLGPSALGSYTMRDLVGHLPVEVYISEIVPSPLDTKMPLIADYQRDMLNLHKKNFDFFSLEGYIGAAIFAEAVKRTGAQLTAAGIAKTLEGMSNVDLGGLKVSFNPQKHQALDSNFVFHLKNGQLKPVK